MIDQIFTWKKRRERMKRNCLSEIIVDMFQHYQSWGMGGKPVLDRLHYAGLFGDWLKRRRIPVSHVTSAMAEEFILSANKRMGGKSKCLKGHVKTLAAGVRCAVRIIRQKWPPIEQSPSNIERELSAFCQFLEKHRGCCRRTIQLYRRYLGLFLAAIFADDEIIIERIPPERVHEYVMTSLEHYAPKTVRGDICCSIRLYFKYKKICGYDTDRLIASIPRLRFPRVCLSPDILSDDELEGLWQAFDRSTATGRRDYAAVRCMSDLGMRVGDVTRLELEDINWRESIIRVNNSKGVAPVWLPLPDTVGEAIADYLQNGRPNSGSRRVFLRSCAPRDKPANPTMFTIALIRAFKRLGLFPKYSGAHVLRHTAATRMRRAGVNLKTLADVLGHNHIQTTTLYAQVDLPALRAVAQPWPGVRS